MKFWYTVVCASFEDLVWSFGEQSALNCFFWIYSFVMQYASKICLLIKHISFPCREPALWISSANLFSCLMKDWLSHDKWIKFSSLSWESEKMKPRRSSRTPKQPQHVRQKSQTDLSAWRKRGRTDSEKSLQSHQSANDQKYDSQEGSLEEALRYLEKGKTIFFSGYLRLRK